MIRSRYYHRNLNLQSKIGVQVIAATNRPDVLDPALLRSGRLDRSSQCLKQLKSWFDADSAGKIELPHPTETARARIMQIHSRKMNVDKDDVNFEELARCCDDFNGAQCKAVCVEVGLLVTKILTLLFIGRNARTTSWSCFCETWGFHGRHINCCCKKERISWILRLTSDSYVPETVDVHHWWLGRVL